MPLALQLLDDNYYRLTNNMAEVADSKAVEAVEQKTAESANGAGEVKAEETSNGASDVKAEKTNGDDEKKSDDKPTEQNGAAEDKKQDYSRDRDQHDRKRRGSFNNDRRGGGRGRGDAFKRGRSGGGRGRGPNQNKSRFEDLPESNDETEIRRQVDFYFSDSNLPVDQYLLKLTGGRDNRPVPLKTIHDFKRMRHFQPYSAVRNAVANSSFLNLSDDDEITRKVPIDEKYSNHDVNYNRKLAQTSSMARSIYVKGFGDESERTQLDVEGFFEVYGPIQAVRLRRHDDGFFKGSVFVEFETEELQKTFLALDPKPMFDDKELKIMSKSEYVEGKNEDILEGKVIPRSPTRRGGGNFNDRGGKYDKDDWKQRREHDQRDDRSGRGGRGRGRGGRGGRGGNRYNNARDRSRSGSPNDRFGRERREEKEVKHPNANELDGEKKTESEKMEEAAKAGAEAGNAEQSKKRTRQDGDDGEAEKGDAKKVKEAEAEA